MPKDFSDDVSHYSPPWCDVCDTRHYRNQPCLGAGDPVEVPNDYNPAPGGMTRVHFIDHSITVDQLSPEHRAIYNRAVTKPKPKVYIIGALSNPQIPHVGNAIRAAGFEVFDDWHSVGPRCDQHWQEYEDTRGRTYEEAINGQHANHAYELDRRNLEAHPIGVLVLPAGKSAHMEFGTYCQRPGRFGYVLFEEMPKRFDLMYKLANGLFFDQDKLLDWMKAVHL
jgi:hypothetical protein